MKECCVVDDESKGKNDTPVRALNGVDDNKLPIFNYITSISYQSGVRRVDTLVVVESKDVQIPGSVFVL